MRSAGTTDVGILSRDAGGTTAGGHIGLLMDEAGRLAVRLQGLGGLDDPDAGQCTIAPLAVGRWVHVLVNFGPPGLELFVDGERATRQQPTRFVGFDIPCGTDSPRGISGNQNPWLLGADSSQSSEGSAEFVRGFLLGGAVDHLVIRSARRPPPRRPPPESVR